MSKRNRVECVCKGCGKDFTVPPSTIRKGGGKYCSRDCTKKGENRECPVCSTSFSRRLIATRIFNLAIRSNTHVIQINPGGTYWTRKRNAGSRKMKRRWACLAAEPGNLGRFEGRPNIIGQRLGSRGPRVEMHRHDLCGRHTHTVLKHPLPQPVG